MTGAELYALRESRKLSQQKLANLIRVNRQTVGRWERQQNEIGYAEEQLLLSVLRHRKGKK